MTDNSDLIARLRRYRGAQDPPSALQLEAADALEAAQRPPLTDLAGLDAAILRLKAWFETPREPLNYGHERDLRTVIAAAQRPPLTDATRERLIAKIAVVLDGETGGASELYRANVYGAVADAILAEFRPVASTRERLAEALAVTMIGPERWAAFDRAGRAIYEGHAGRVLASGAVEDRAEVETKALEAWADDEVEALAPHPGSMRDQMVASVRARAASIREGRS